MFIPFMVLIFQEEPVQKRKKVEKGMGKSQAAGAILDRVKHEVGSDLSINFEKKI